MTTGVINESARIKRPKKNFRESLAIDPYHQAQNQALSFCCSGTIETGNSGRSPRTTASLTS